MHKELLHEIIDSWSTDKIQNYIVNLEVRRRELNEEIVYLKNLLKKRNKKPLDTGVRGG